MTRAIDLHQNVGPSVPVVVRQVRLNNDFNSCFHRVTSSLEATVFIESAFVREYDMPPIREIRKVRFFMPKSALLKNRKSRIVPVELVDLTSRRAQIQRA